METAREKAIKWLYDNVPGFDERYSPDDVESLSLLLKEHAKEMIQEESK